MSEQTKVNGIDGYVRMIITVVLTVAGSWASVRNEVHGYIDTRLDEMSIDITRTMGAQMHGRMLQVMDSTSAHLHQFDDSTNARLQRIEERVGVRVTNRTVIMPTDTAAMRNLERRMLQLERGIEAVLDGMSRAERKRAHNVFPPN